MSTLASVIIRDLFANRPAASISGRLFFASDTLKFYRDNGASWDELDNFASFQSAIQQENYIYAADTGAANAYAVTLSPVPTIVTGSVVVFKATNANSGASTLAVNGGAAIALVKSGSTALVSGDIKAGQIIFVIYDGTNFQITGANSGGSALTVSGMYLTDGTNFFIGPTNFPCTLPVAGNYAWVNQGTATEVAGGNALLLSDNTAGTIQNIRIRTKSIGAKTTLIVALAVFLPSDGGANHNPLAGIGFRESATGKLLTINYTTLLGAANVPRGEIDVFSLTSPTAFNATRTAWQMTGTPQVGFFKIVYNGTNVTVFTSPDGINWFQLYTAAKTADFTTAPDQWFYFVDPQGNVPACSATLLSWTES